MDFAWAYNYEPRLSCLVRLNFSVLFIYFIYFLVKIEVVVETRSKLGESPHYDPQRNEVIWVDCDGKSINFFDVESKRNRKLLFEKKVAIAIPCTSGNSVLALMEKNICLVNRDTGKQNN